VVVVHQRYETRNGTTENEKIGAVEKEDNQKSYAETTKFHKRRPKREPTRHSQRAVQAASLGHQGEKRDVANMSEMDAGLQQNEKTAEKLEKTPIRVEFAGVQDQPDASRGDQKLGKIPQQEKRGVVQLTQRNMVQIVAFFKNAKSLHLFLIQPSTPVIHQPVGGIDDYPKHGHRGGSEKKRAVDDVLDGNPQRGEIEKID